LDFNEIDFLPSVIEDMRTGEYYDEDEE